MKKVFTFLIILILSAFSVAFAAGGWIDKGGYLEQNYQTGPITFIKYSKDGKTIFTFGSDSILRKWDVESGSIIKETRINKGLISTFDVNSDGSKYAYSHIDDSHVHVYDFKKDTIFSLYSKTGYKPKNDGYYTEVKVISFQFHPIYEQILIEPFLKREIPEDWTSGMNIEDGVITVFSTDDYQLRYSTQGGSAKGNLTFSPDGEIVAFCTYNSYYESFHGSVIQNYKGKSTVITDKNFLINNTIDTSNNNYYGCDFSKYLLAFSPDSKLLAYYNSGTIKIYNANESRLLYSLVANKVEHLTALGFTYDSKCLVTAANNGYSSKINFWAIPSGDSVLSYDLYDSELKFAYNRDGKYLAAGGTDGILRIFKNITPDTIIASFYANNREIFENYSIRFIDISEGKIKEWLWDFGDSLTSSEQNPVHCYKSTGNYTVTLIVTSFLGNKDTLIMKDYIHVIKKPDCIADDIDNSFTSLYSYPNPASDKILIKYTLPSDEFVRLTLYNIYGEAVLVNELKSAGDYTAEFNAALLPAGSYYYRLKRGENIRMGMLSLVK